MKETWNIMYPEQTKSDESHLIWAKMRCAVLLLGSIKVRSALMRLREFVACQRDVATEKTIMTVLKGNAPISSFTRGISREKMPSCGIPANSRHTRLNEKM